MNVQQCIARRDQGGGGSRGIVLSRPPFVSQTWRLENIETAIILVAIRNPLSAHSASLDIEKKVR